MRGHGEYKMPDGKLVVADVAIVDGVLRAVAVSGDFFLEPDSALDAVNAALDGLPANVSLDMLTAVGIAGVPPQTQMYGVDPEAFAVAVHSAILAAKNSGRRGGRVSSRRGFARDSQEGGAGSVILHHPQGRFGDAAVVSRTPS